MVNAHTAAYRLSLNETESQSQTQPLNSAIKHYDPSTTIKKFKHKIEPTISRSSENRTLNFTLDAIQSEIMQISEPTTTRDKDNLSRAKRKALTSLKDNKSIVVNKADKGPTIVVQNKEDYIENGLKHLDNPTVHQRLPTQRCGRQDCTVCPRLLTKNSIHVRHLSYNVRIPDHTPPLTCTTNNVVYVIKCKQHHKAYVGQTTNMVRVRISKHIAMIKSFHRSKKTNIGHHFNDPQCSLANLVWTPVDIIPPTSSKRDAEARLQKLETLWIRKMCSMQPWGMNHIEIDTSVRTRPDSREWTA